MNQPCNQDENIVGRALYELIRICNKVDLDMNNKDKDISDEIAVMRGRRKIKVKL